MAEENASAMNLDLNLGPIDDDSNIDGESRSESYVYGGMNLEDWLDDPTRRVREVVRHRNQRWRSFWRQIPVPLETRNLAVELTSQTGGGSEERPTEVAAKICEHGSGKVDDEGVDKLKDGGKSNSEDGSFFDCNICLDLAKDPVVTCCGHLFCWPCLYRWLQFHSDAKECPVCKGEVTTKDVTPIYGSGGNNKADAYADINSNLMIPLRPQARRIGSCRQTIQRTADLIPDGMISLLENTADLSHIQPQNSDGTQESQEMSNYALLNRMPTSRGLRREREREPSSAVLDLTETPHRLIGTTFYSSHIQPQNSDGTQESQEMSNNPLLNPMLTSRGLRRRREREPLSAVIDLTDTPRRHSSRLLYRSTVPVINMASATDSADNLAAERLIESYFHSNPPVERNGAVNDRDSLSSIAALIHSESQTLDNAVEIDSTISLSTSPSRRRNYGSRISDMDSGESRFTRRRLG